MSPGTPASGYCGNHDYSFFGIECPQCMEETLGKHARGGSAAHNSDSGRVHWEVLDTTPRRHNQANLEMVQLLHTLDQIKVEVLTAKSKWPTFNSAHEGYAILLEEVHELWDHVKTHQKNRNLAAMRMEAVQVAAMALRFATEVCDEERGRK